MNAVKNAVKSYITNEEGAEEIVTVILTVLGLGAAIAIGVFVWNILQNQSKKAQSDTSKIDKQDPFSKNPLD